MLSLYETFIENYILVLNNYVSRDEKILKILFDDTNLRNKLTEIRYKFFENKHPSLLGKVLKQNELQYPFSICYKLLDLYENEFDNKFIELEKEINRKSNYFEKELYGKVRIIGYAKLDYEHYSSFTYEKYGKLKHKVLEFELAPYDIELFNLLTEDEKFIKNIVIPNEIKLIIDNLQRKIEKNKNEYDNFLLLVDNLDKLEYITNNIYINDNYYNKLETILSEIIEFVKQQIEIIKIENIIVNGQISF